MQKKCIKKIMAKASDLDTSSRPPFCSSHCCGKKLSAGVD